VKSFVKDNVYETVKSLFYVQRIGRHVKQKNSKFGVGAVSFETYNFKLNSYQSQISEKKETYVLAGINITSPFQDLSTLTANLLFIFLLNPPPPPPPSPPS